MTKDAFSERKQALEDEFFFRVDEKLLAKLNADTAAAAEREQLKAATGLSDESVLNALIAAGASSESVAAISLVPLVLVAWADGKLEAEERLPIMKAAEDQGMVSGTPAASLLEHWLTNKPKAQLASTWKQYIAAVSAQLSDEAHAALRDDIIQRAKAVANATGGVLGFGKISADEKRVIAELEQALTR